MIFPLAVPKKHLIISAIMPKDHKARENMNWSNTRDISIKIEAKKRSILSPNVLTVFLRA